MDFDINTEMTFTKCACGEVTNKVPCWSCTQAERAKDDALRSYNATINSIPIRFRGADAIKRVNNPAFITIDEVLEQEGSMTFLGPAGAGKTTLACIMLSCNAHKGSGRFFTASDIDQARRNSPLGDTPWIIEQCDLHPYLVIDELRGEHTSGAVFDVINARVNKGLVTYVTTGLTRDQIKTAFGDGMFRRLIECAKPVILLGGL